MDIDGILYKKENGVPTELVLCPQQYTRYMTALSMGDRAPATPADAVNLANKLLKEDYIATIDKVIDNEDTIGMYGIVWSQCAADILTVLLSFYVHRRFIKKSGKLDNMQE